MCHWVNILHVSQQCFLLGSAFVCGWGVELESKRTHLCPHHLQFGCMSCFGRGSAVTPPFFHSLFVEWWWETHQLQLLKTSTLNMKHISYRTPTSTQHMNISTCSTSKSRHRSMLCVTSTIHLMQYDLTSTSSSTPNSSTSVISISFQYGRTCAVFNRILTLEKEALNLKAMTLIVIAMWLY